MNLKNVNVKYPSRIGRIAGKDRRRNKQGEKNMANKRKDGQAPKERTPDTRPPNVIFKAKMNLVLTRLNRQLVALGKFGNARKAQPSEKQYQAVVDFVRTNTEKSLTEFARIMRKEEESSAPSQLDVVPEQ